ncbi:class I SAM-dependent methyltransferase [Candidatus Amesbacteria bacterium]|nr:class I SAM-dependent methyltransferase [Candidatus Amesbacteria bacterium]
MIRKMIICRVCRKNIIPNKNIIVSERFFYNKCSFCKSGTLFPFPDNKELKSYYQTQNYYFGLSKGVSNKIIQWIFTRKLFKSYDSWVQSYFTKPGSVLDVGTGNGEFLYSMKQHGWDVWGSDISKLAANNTDSKIYKNRVKVGRFSNQIWNKKFNAVTLWHVLEHEENSFKYTKKAFSLLKLNGRIFGEVPNFESSLLNLFGRTYAWIMVPVHIVYFSPESIKYILKKTGFKNIEIHTPPRALLNFAFSVSRNPLIISLLAPLSILIGILLSVIRKGEVIRFSAQR